MAGESGRERNDRGQFVEEITPEEVIAVLRDSDSPVVTAKEVGEQLGCTGEAARQKLLALRDQGIVERRQVGAGAVVWWLVADESTPEEIGVAEPDDPLFTGGPLFISEDGLDEEELDDVLYGEVE